MAIRCVQSLTIPPTSNAKPFTATPQHAHLELVEPAARGDLALVQELIDANKDPDKPNPTTGLRPLHYAASRGYLDICIALIEKAGASVDGVDTEDETALLKAAYAGHLPVVQYLINEAKADATHQDKDGWTVLHNACSCGHLAMVRFLIRHGGADLDVNAVSRLGHTPLINAASKGDLAIVEYLLHEADADPLQRNAFGETAYDAAAAAGSAYVCQVLEAAERYWSEQSHEPYDVLRSHVTVPVILHENQRATSSFLAIGKPTFSAAALTRNDQRGAWSLYPSGETTTKSHVRLPQQTSWFWLSDWTVDFSHPIADSYGWQYSRSFDEEDENWTSIMPTSTSGWVRRRRWVRIMKRRVEEVLYAPLNTHEQQQVVDEYTNNVSPLDAGHEQHRNLGSFHHVDHQSISGNNNISTGSSSSSSSSSNSNYAPAASGTVSMTLTKAQSVFVGCQTHVQSVEPEPPRNPSSISSPRPSLQSTRSSSLSRIAYVWERNEQAPNCRRCGRWFNFLVRRHHCRRCGLVVCDKCSTNRVMLPFSHIVQDPAVPMEQHYQISLQPQRLCDGCFEELSRPRGTSSNSRPTSVRMGRSSSVQSIMMECPVCGRGLDEFGSMDEQEQHVQTCLNANTPAALSGIRYVVYKLALDSALLGQECVICFEEFIQGDTMARLSCLCTFHHRCIHAWFTKGKECPIHSQ